MKKRLFLSAFLASSMAVPTFAASADPFAAVAASQTPLLIKMPGGKVISLTDEDLAALPQVTLANLVTPWYKEPQTFSGPSLKDIFQKVGIRPNDKLRIVAHNDYSVDLPASDAWNFRVIVATHNNGQRMSLKQKGPFFTMYPLDDPKVATQQYFSRCVWQVISIDVK